jgi:hypothetical protein
MATIPVKRSMTASVYDILNAIRNNATSNYRDFVPKATDTKSLRQIGAIMMEYQAVQNEFLTALWNRIGRVILSTKMYENPWSMFKRGQLDYGETVEEIFTNIAKPFQYDPEKAEQTIYKRQIPDVRSAFHTMNYQKFYKTTTTQEQLRQAFLSEGGVEQLINDIISSLLKAANYDEFQVMKYLLFRNILNGRMFPKEIDTVTPANMKSIIADVKSISNKLTFLKPYYNVAGVQTTSEKNDQFILIDTDFQAHMDVEVLASAFNMNKAEFMGHIVPVDGFGELDTDRLAILFEDDDSYVPITPEQLQALSIIPCVLVDRSYFMIFDNLIENTQKFNEEGLYWNYWLHTWKTFSVSPFANAVMFLPATPSVVSVSVSPDSATITAGASIQLTPVVAVLNFAPQTVKYESDSDTIVVSDMGVVTALAGASGSATITVTSTFDLTKFDTMTVTVA